MSPTVPRSPAEHHYVEAETIIGNLGQVRSSMEAEDADREVQVALVHAVLAVAAAVGVDQ